MNRYRLYDVVIMHFGLFWLFRELAAIGFGVFSSYFVSFFACYQNKMVKKYKNYPINKSSNTADRYNVSEQ